MVKNDVLIQGKTRTKREFCSFYTESNPILDYMMFLLNIKKGDKILEPCGGEGAFVEKILIYEEQYNRLDVLDLNNEAISNLQNKFPGNNINIRLCDTLLDNILDDYELEGGFYNKIIANPPYGAWQDFNKREVLKKKYKGYVKESYTLFLHRCINLLKKEGRGVFIIPDTFLAISSHKGIREKILKETIIENITLIPSNFFPGVNFGYANLCIISLVKINGSSNNGIEVFREKEDVNNLYKIIDFLKEGEKKGESIEQETILNNENYSFLLGGDNFINNIINDRSIKKLGDLADCVTGFYSGDNKKYLGVLNEDTRGGKGYNIINKDIIEYENGGDLEGLTNEKKYIPILKGGKGIFNRESEWLVKWDRETITHYKKDRKARFQNPRFYFKQGIAVPMVKSSKMKAFLIDNRLIDQALVGVIPFNRELLYYLLAFLNSDICNKMIRAINHTANNSSNYLKRLPVIVDERYLTDINKLTDMILKGIEEEENLNKINLIFNKVYGK